MSGKGSAPRPYSVDAETFANNFDAIFGKKEIGNERRDAGVPILLDTEAASRVPDEER